MRLLLLFTSLLAVGCASPSAPRRLVVAPPSGALTLVPDATSEEQQDIVFTPRLDRRVLAATFHWR